MTICVYRRLIIPRHKIISIPIKNAVKTNTEHFFEITITINVDAKVTNTPTNAGEALASTSSSTLVDDQPVSLQYLEYLECRSGVALRMSI